MIPAIVWSIGASILEKIAGSGWAKDTLAKVVKNISSFMKRGEPTAAAMKILEAEIDAMIAVGRDPTAEEIDACWERIAEDYQHMTGKPL